MTLQERLRKRAEWYRGINRAVNHPRPKRDADTADLLEEAACELDRVRAEVIRRGAA